MQLTDFEGTWVITRQIHDLRHAARGRFEGRASLRPDAAQHKWIWQEDGLLTMGAAAPLKATRRYLWDTEAGRIRVHFDDGRFFHEFDPARGRAEAAHLCLRDNYLVSYNFASWPVWRAEWRVTGPAKDYLMTSEYARPRG